MLVLIPLEFISLSLKQQRSLLGLLLELMILLFEHAVSFLDEGYVGLGGMECRSRLLAFEGVAVVV